MGFILFIKLISDEKSLTDFLIPFQGGVTESGQVQEAGSTSSHSRLKSGMNVTQTAIFIASQISGLAVLVIPPLLVDSGKPCTCSLKTIPFLPHTFIYPSFLPFFRVFSIDLFTKLFKFMDVSFPGT